MVEEEGKKEKIIIGGRDGGERKSRGKAEIDNENLESWKYEYGRGMRWWRAVGRGGGTSGERDREINSFYTQSNFLISTDETGEVVPL